MAAGNSQHHQPVERRLGVRPQSRRMLDQRNTRAHLISFSLSLGMQIPPHNKTLPSYRSRPDIELGVCVFGVIVVNELNGI